jgi:hypothetical protein
MALLEYDLSSALAPGSKCCATRTLYAGVYNGEDQVHAGSTTNTVTSTISGTHSRHSYTMALIEIAVPVQSFSASLIMK